MAMISKENQDVCGCMSAVFSALWDFAHDDKSQFPLCVDSMSAAIEETRHIFPELVSKMHASELEDHLGDWCGSTGMLMLKTQLNHKSLVCALRRILPAGG